VGELPFLNIKGNMSAVNVACYTAACLCVPAPDDGM